MKNLLITLVLCICCININSQTKTIGITLQANLGEWTTFDGCVTYYNQSSNDVNLEDAQKLSNPLENIAISRTNVLLAVEQRNTYATIPLELWNLRDLQYKLIINKTNISKYAVLEDLLEHVIVSLDSITEYIFYTDTFDVRDRFRISFPCPMVISTTPTINPEIAVNNVMIYPNPSKDYVIIKGLEAGRHNIKFVGSVIKTFPIVSFNNSLTLRNNMPAGVYFVFVDDKYITTQIINK